MLEAVPGCPGEGLQGPRMARRAGRDPPGGPCMANREAPQQLVKGSLNGDSEAPEKDCIWKQVWPFEDFPGLLWPHYPLTGFKKRIA